MACDNLAPRSSGSLEQEESMRQHPARLTSVFVSALAVASLAMAAEPQLAGTWKLNLAKSQLGGAVYTFEKKESGLWHYSGGGFDTDFDLTGKEYTMPSGAALAVKELGPNSWKMTSRMGKVTSKGKATLNGDSMSWVWETSGPDGKAVLQESTDTRVSGGPGFEGKWKSGNLEGTATTLKIATEGASGITIEVPEAQVVCKAAFDGKEYPVMIGGQPSKMTNSFTRTAPNSMKVITKMSGKEMAIDVYTVSADGKTLTDNSTATATNEETSSVFDRQ
jgi:hypothetical protein